MIITEDVATQAAAHLSQHDRALAPVIDRAGICPVRSHTNYYGALVDSIISQQLSVKAARSIEVRFCQLFELDTFPQAERILTKDIDELRSAGLSRAKAIYIKDLAQHIVDGSVHFNHFPKLSNDEIIKELIKVRGIGEWTVHMFLIFCMARSDILPHGDLGIKNGMQGLYGLEHIPSLTDMRAIADTYQWHPYESIASWYVWRSLENAPAIAA